MTTSPVPLGPGREFDRIRAISQRLGARGTGLGDDAAIVTFGTERVALSCDLAVEGRHFRVEWLEPEEIGWRAAAAALSDLAAVAAQPLGALASVGVPEARAGDFLLRLMEGVGEAVSHAGASVWGGDLVQSDRVVLDVTVVGRVERVVARRGARPGDGLWVTGRLGAPSEAVMAWEGGRAPRPELRARFAHPVPRVAEACWLRDHGADAMIDVSDGIAGDAGHLAAASEVALRIDADRVPIHPGVSRWESGVVGGEEYELLVALPSSFPSGAADEFARRFALPLTRIGDVTSGSGVVVTRGGRVVDLPGGYSHF